jgi:hypothetical protein
LQAGQSARRIVGLQGLTLLVALVALVAARPGQPAPVLTGGPWITESLIRGLLAEPPPG